jgi:hypothetical protein
MFLNNLAKKIWLDKARKGVAQTIKEGRLSFINAELVSFTGKDGKVQQLTLGALSGKVMEQSGFYQVTGAGVSPSMVLDITITDINKIIVEEYNKHGKSQGR